MLNDPSILSGAMVGFRNLNEDGTQTDFYNLQKGKKRRTVENSLDKNKKVTGS